MIDPQLGFELRRRRIAAGITLRELARRILFDTGYLSKIETGKRPASPHVVRRYDGQLNAHGELIELARGHVHMRQ